MKRILLKRTAMLLVLSVTGFMLYSCTPSGDGPGGETTNPTIPVVTTNDVSNITYTTAEVAGIIVSNGNSSILRSGFCWSRNPVPTISDNVSLDGSPSGTFKTNMQNLEEGVDYYVRAYATNIAGTGYGAEKKFTTNLSCQTMVSRRQGYQVWAGNQPYYQLANHYDYFYSIDKYYTLIGESTTTQTFNTGTYLYYVIVSKYWNCLDAIQFNDGTYYNHGQGYTLITGLAEVAPITGAPDGVFGKFGTKGICPPNGTATYNAYITDDKTITSRGGGLRVIVGSGCQ